MTRRVLVVGGTGAFGSRLVEGLVTTTDLEVVIGARDVQRAERFAASLRNEHPGRAIDVQAIDIATVLPGDLAGIWCVVDAAGPFQDAPPKLAEAAIAARCHYVDIADARDFVAAFPRLSKAACEAGVLAVTGASSTPGLSQAVLDKMLHGWSNIQRIEIAISPGNRQPRGLSVVKAILATAGKPTKVFAADAG